MKGKYRNAFNGLALAVIRPLNKPGPVRLTVTSPGLTSATLEIDTPMTLKTMKVPADIKK